MATETPIANPAVKTIERTRTVTWSSREGVPHAIEAQLETQPLDAGNGPVGYAQAGARVVRPYNRIKDETVDVDGQAFTVEDLAAALVDLVERWREEDLAPPEQPARM